MSAPRGRKAKVIPFEPPPKRRLRPAYVPHKRHGEVFIVERQRGNGTGWAVMFRSPAGAITNLTRSPPIRLASRSEAQAAAWVEARKRNATVTLSDFVDCGSAAMVSTRREGGRP